MSYTPKRIIALNEEDLAEAKKKFLYWSSGKLLGVKFLTFDEALEQNLEMNPYAYDIENQLSDKVKNHIINILPPEAFTLINTRPEVIPEPAHPRKVNRKLGRNQPCPCGSGKKLKKCCVKFETF